MTVFCKYLFGEGKFFLLLAGSPLQFETRQFSTLKKGSRETKTTKLGVQTRVLFQIESSSV